MRPAASLRRPGTHRSATWSCCSRTIPERAPLCANASRQYMRGAVSSVGRAGEFNPKVAGSSPARPIRRCCISRRSPRDNRHITRGSQLDGGLTRPSLDRAPVCVSIARRAGPSPALRAWRSVVPSPQSERLLTNRPIRVTVAALIRGRGVVLQLSTVALAAATSATGASRAPQFLLTIVDGTQRFEGTLNGQPEGPACTAQSHGVQTLQFRTPANTRVIATKNPATAGPGGTRSSASAGRR